MRLSQFKHIEAVGRFRAASATGDVTLKKYTVVFGENGRGKSTLCAILRSLQLNSPDILAGRKTLGGTDEPQVFIKVADGTTVQFRNGAWSPSRLNLRIFDAQYVAENVYSGDAIGSDQRRNLCRTILGRQGVQLAQQYDAIDEQINAKNAAIREARRAVTAHVPAAEIEDFLRLGADPEIDSKIEAKTRELEAVRQFDEVRRRPGFEEIELPPLPNQLEATLARTVADVSRNAEAQVKAHLAAHGLEGNSQWLAQGLAHTTDECPFCGQSVEGVSIIEFFRQYFNHSYTTFRRELDAYQKQCRTAVFR